jgi:RNA polymerase sigma-70 factor (TIGR02943 family)
MSKEILDPKNWVDLYADMMYRFSLVRVKDSEAADELVQATFFAALKSQHTFAGKSSEKTWLFGILKHKIMDYFRRSKKHISIDPTSSEETDRIQCDSNGHMNPKPTNWNMDPEKAAENSESAEILATCLEGLPDKFDKLFVLKEIDGMSSEKICNEFGIKPTNLWVILHRARNQLKKCMESNWLNTK